jgi:hypothetical protein
MCCRIQARVINKSTHAVLYTLGVSGTETIADGEVVWGNGLKKIYVLDAAKLDVPVPSFGTFETYGVLRATAGADFSSITRLSLMFNGYSGSAVMEGVIRKTGKVYNY